jgi:hypothetical protein
MPLTIDRQFRRFALSIQTERASSVADASRREMSRLFDTERATSWPNTGPLGTISLCIGKHRDWGSPGIYLWLFAPREPPMLLSWRKPAFTTTKKRHGFVARPKSWPVSRCGYSFWISRINTICSRIVSSGRACTRGIHPFDPGRPTPNPPSRGYQRIFQQFRGSPLRSLGRCQLRTMRQFGRCHRARDGNSVACGNVTIVTVRRTNGPMGVEPFPEALFTAFS